MDASLQNCTISNYKDIDYQIVQIALYFFEFCQEFDDSRIFLFKRFNVMQIEVLEILDPFMYRFQLIKTNILIMLGQDLNKFTFFVDNLIHILQVKFNNTMLS